MSSLPWSWTQQIRRDLQPTPGRLAGALRIVLATVLSLILLMVWQMPFAWLGLYFVFLIGRDSPSVSFRSGVLSMLAVAAAIAVEIAVVAFTDNDPMARVLSVVIVAFLAAFLSVSITLPALPQIWGFIFCTVIALWESHAPAESLVTNSLWLLAAGTLPVACSIAVEYVFASRDPVAQLQEARRVRYQAIEKMFELYAQGGDSPALAEAKLSVSRLAAAGQTPMQRLYDAIVDRNLDPGSLPLGTRVRVTMLAQLIDLAAAFASLVDIPDTPEARQRYARIAKITHELGQNKIPSLEEEHKLTRVDENLTLLSRVEEALGDILSMPIKSVGPEDRGLVALPSKKVPLFIPGALHNKDNLAFALKICFCATVCYILNFALAWPGIGTSVVTVFIVGLSTTGAIKQKSIYRFVGSAIGGLVLGIGSAAFLFPYMDSITSLVVLVACIAFIAAWMAGGRVFNYVGLQIAFAFYLVAFEGFRAPTELAPPRDRLVGILLALLVMWFVFDRLWPVRTVTVMRRSLAAVLQTDAGIFRIGEEGLPQEEQLRRADALRDRIGKTVASLRTLNDEIPYEFGVNRELHARIGAAILRAAFASVALFWNELSVLHTEQELLKDKRLVEMRHKMAEEMDIMAKSVGANAAYVAVDPAIFIGQGPLESARCDEYARNAVARFDDLQKSIANIGINI